MRESTVEALHAHGLKARGCGDLQEAVRTVSQEPADIVVLNLGTEDSLHCLHAIRTAAPDLGVVVVSALNRSSDRADCYEAGADIYLVKPVSSAELVAAVRALARRTVARSSNPALQPAQALAPGSTLNARPLLVQTATLQLVGPAAIFDLSDTEAHILSAFSRTADQRLEVARLMEIVGRNGVPPRKATLEVQMVRLRKKLASSGAAQPTIKSIRGMGYQLCVPIRIDSSRLSGAQRPSSPSLAS